MPDSGIYRIDFPNGKFYYGQSQSLRTRKNSHMSNLRSGKHGNPIMQACWNKYGEATFTKVMSVPVDRLDEVEQSYLNVFVGMENCANIAVDAAVPARGLTRSPETREKIRKAKTGTRMSEEAREKMSKAKTGTRRSEETREKIRKARTGTRRSEETCSKMRASQRANAPTYSWTNPEHGDVDAPIWEMIERWPDLSGGSLYLVHSGQRNHHKGWRKRDG